ncbi:MAG: O-antigen ligase family protein [Flavitalea sp.]
MHYALLLICIFFTYLLLQKDLKKSDRPSGALWIPLLWMFFSGTKEFSNWFNLGYAYSQDAFESGNIIDLMFQLSMILFGVVIISQRRINWGQFLAQNKVICLYFLFAGMSIVWSDYPFVSFKRLIKAMGVPIMALVILTEKAPYEAFGDVLRRLAILVIPLSLILCKFYPEYGRGHHHDSWTYIGLAAGKNMLGVLCLLSGFYFLWDHIFRNRFKERSGSEPSRLMTYSFLAITMWTLHYANSATSLTCLIVALCLLLVARIPLIYHNPRMVIPAGAIFITVASILELNFKVSELALNALNRDPTLTNRSVIWDDLMSMVKNPFIGTGYESFWLGTRLNYLFIKYAGILQSHNGYLETYLNLGYIGLVLMLASFFSGLLKVQRHLTLDYPAAIMRLSLIVINALYNWTEAAFYGITNIWLLFFVAVIDVSLLPEKKASTVNSPRFSQGRPQQTSAKKGLRLRRML